MPILPIKFGEVTREEALDNHPAVLIPAADGGSTVPQSDLQGHGDYDGSCPPPWTGAVPHRNFAGCGGSADYPNHVDKDRRDNLRNPDHVQAEVQDQTVWRFYSL